MRFAARLIIFMLAALSIFNGGLNADIIYLKNGRSIEGFIEKADDKSIDLEVGFGTIKIEKEQIFIIHRSSPEEVERIYEKWAKQRQEIKKRDEKAKLVREAVQKEAAITHGKSKMVTQEINQEPKEEEIEIARRGRHIYVEAILNDEVYAALMLDTGASFIVLSNKKGKELGIDTDFLPDDKEGIIAMTMADGTNAKAKYVRLRSVSAQGIEVKDVGACVLLEDKPNTGFKDGLLGMSFLNKFNFAVDRENNRLVLEELTNR
ncbi:MAG: retropepsin-like aspartic protease [Candidatus Omnitrophica bacterium]|nr:retropepsin-like aspartic protease [Candidatus Omnitrophota bacterium]